MRRRSFTALWWRHALVPPGVYPPAPHPLASALANVPDPSDAAAFAKAFVEGHAKRTGQTLRAAGLDLVRHAPEHMRERYRKALEGVA